MISNKSEIKSEKNTTIKITKRRKNGIRLQVAYEELAAHNNGLHLPPKAIKDAWVLDKVLAKGGIEELDDNELGMRLDGLHTSANLKKLEKEVPV